MTGLAGNKAERRHRPAVGERRSVFILSLKDRDALAELASGAGWKATSARRSVGAAKRYLAGDATVALVDVRGGQEALIELMREAVESSGGALIMLIAPDQLDQAPSLIAEGATHYLCDPVNGKALAATLASAEQVTRRLNGTTAIAVSADRQVGQRHHSGRDFLTGLVNRQTAVGWIDDHLDRSGESPIVLLLSIGPFDRVNAAYGQIAGDALLGRVARRLERLAEEYVGRDVLMARIAGTEYMVGIPPARLDAERAVFLARRMLATVSQPFSAGEHLIRLTGRCGIAEGMKGDDAIRLLRRAGTALADAKQAGGEGLRILTASARSREADPDRLESDLRLALDRDEIDVVFQPQYSCSSNVMTGVEALARWNHPHYGALGAAALFSAAERSDFLLPLSAHIQAAALRQASAWPSSLAALRLSVNVTASDISQPQFLEAFLSSVHTSGFPRSRLTVEITESGLIEDVPAAAALLARLREAGLAVAIDDFGTGYSSLAYLKALPLDYLKIDSGLAQDIAGSERDRIVVRGVIRMAKSLGMQVIAEGVETQEQRDLLTADGCDFYQGFLMSPAISSADLVELIDK